MLYLDRNVQKERSMERVSPAIKLFFYAWWDWRFLGLVVFSSVVDISKVQQLSTDSVYVFRKLIRQEVRLLQLESLAI